MIDTVNASQKSFTDDILLDSYTSLLNIDKGVEYDINSIPKPLFDNSINIISFNIENHDYVKGTLSINGLKSYRLYIDGKKSEGKEISLVPGTHTFVIKYLSIKGVEESPSVSFETENSDDIIIGTGGKRLYTINMQSPFILIYFSIYFLSLFY